MNNYQEHLICKKIDKYIAYFHNYSTNISNESNAIQYDSNVQQDLYFLKNIFKLHNISLSDNPKQSNNIWITK